MWGVESIESYVGKTFDHFGTNKRREVIRLLFEIAKREQCYFEDIVKDYRKDLKSFIGFKKYLIQRRFPNLSRTKEGVNPFLPELTIDPECGVHIQKREQISPQSFYIEEGVRDAHLVKQLLKKYPEAQVSFIGSYTTRCREKKLSIQDYNHRLDHFYIIKESFDFFKRCPCSPKMVPCGYHLMNLGSGCAFECVYCYLQEYINSPGIVIPANIEDFFEKFSAYKQNVYLGSGEFTDSLVFDHITEFSSKIVEFFKDYPQSTFEFKTKSNNINLLQTVRSAGNIVVAWSMNPQKIIDTAEFYTASLKERLEAAVICAKLGYKIAFHFDPIIYYDGWEADYYQVVDLIFEHIPEKYLDRISLGTLRMVTDLKKIIENRFPDNIILDGELGIGYDKKLRYGSNLRLSIYKKMLERIRSHSQNIQVYLCMEEKSMCQECLTYPKVRKG